MKPPQKSLKYGVQSFQLGEHTHMPEEGHPKPVGSEAPLLGPFWISPDPSLCLAVTYTLYYGISQ